MSYDIELIDPVTEEVLTVDELHQMRGGTYAVGGSNELRLNVTYNYARHFIRVFPAVLPTPANEWGAYEGHVIGIRTIYGLTGAESIPVLDRAIEMLGDGVHENYWEPTEGNAKRALTQLRAMATMRPDGVWTGD